MSTDGAVTRSSDVVGLLGGLGNQLFQFALGVALEERWGVRARFDLSAFRSTPDYLGLQDLGARLDRAPGLRLLPHPTGRLRDAAILTRRLLPPRRVRLESERSTAAAVLDGSARPAWYYGFWQFPDIVRLALPRMRSRMPALGQPVADRIGLHVRRGDMLASTGGASPDYYREAVQVLRTRAGDPDLEVLVCSDDIAWCREHLGISGVRFSAGARPADDLLALTSSRSLVLSPSTFSWWAAVLTEHDPEAVVSPRSFPSPRDLLDPRWTVLDESGDRR